MNNVADLESKKIIILDDSELWLQAINIWLKNWGFENLTSCNTSKRYLDVLDDSYDVIIIDYFLEEGIEAPSIIKKTKEINEHALIICASGLFVKDGNTNFDKMTQALNAGANRAVPKEINSIGDVLKSHLHIRNHSEYDPQDPFAFDYRKLST